MAIDFVAAACDAIAAHFDPIADLTAFRGWREHGVTADLSSGGELAVVPGFADYRRCSPRQVDEAPSPPDTLVTYRYAWATITTQLSLWAPYRSKRDDLVQAIEAASVNGMPRTSDLRIGSPGYFGRPLTVRLSRMTSEDSGGDTTRGTFTQVWACIIETDLVAQATHPQQLQIDAVLSTTLGGVTITETKTLTP